MGVGLRNENSLPIGGPLKLNAEQCSLVDEFPHIAPAILESGIYGQPSAKRNGQTFLQRQIAHTEFRCGTIF